MCGRQMSPYPVFPAWARRIARPDRQRAERTRRVGIRLRDRAAPGPVSPPHRARSIMVPRNAARSAVAVAAVLVAACYDAPTPTGPDARAAVAGQGQDRLEALFRKASPEVMALPGTVFADNDEAVGKLVFGVDNIGAVRSVEGALARL